MKFIINLFLLLSLISCNTKDLETKSIDRPISKDTSVVKQEKTKKEVTTKQISGPIKSIKNLVEFNISECESIQPNDSGKLVINKLIEDTLVIKVKHWINCSYKEAFLESIDTLGDTLNFEIDIPHKEIIEGDYIMAQYSGLTDCNCFSEINLTLKNIKLKPNTITINRQKIKNGYWNPAR